MSFNVSSDYSQSSRLLQRIEQLTSIGIALSAETNCTCLMERILVGAKELTHADGGTLYSLDHEAQVLKFEIMRTDSLAIAMGGTTGIAIPYAPIPLYNPVTGLANEHTVVAFAALQDKTVNIKDVYLEQGFDFSGTRMFDQKIGYRSKSFLTIPLKNHENDVIGVLQLLNKKDPESGELTEFTLEDQRLAQSLASQAAISLTNKKLMTDIQALFEAFIQLIATAIDEKSPYTGGHCKRVPILTMLLAEAAHQVDYGELKDFHLTHRDRYELEIAGWLHDCGKVTTPEYVVDKATKLETIFDRLELVRTRFEVLKRDAEIAWLRQELSTEAYQAKIRQYDEDMAFLKLCNTGGEFMSEDLKTRVRQMAAQYQWRDADGQLKPGLTDNEVYNLTISKGTLTPEERTVINNHIVATIRMLKSLPFPKHLKNVPEYAGGHHERMDGKGYPNGLTREQMSVQARVMAIADIFEALTAVDRPYKKGKTLSESLHILGLMKQDHHIDPALFDVFIREKVYLRYAEQFLSPDQIDAVDESKIPGYAP